MKSIKMRGVVAAVSGALMFGFGANAMADSTDDILNALIAKGVLTEEEGTLLQKGRTGEKEAAEKKKKTSVSGKFKDGISFETGDGENKFSVNGRVQLDHRSYDWDNASAAGPNVTDTFDVRRAYLGAKGTFNKYYDFEVTADFAAQSNTSHLDVAYMNIKWWDQAQFQFGQFKMPFSLEERTSSRFIDFQERSFVNNTSLTAGKERGAMVHGTPFKGANYALAFSTGQGKNTNDVDVREDGKDIILHADANLAEMMGYKESVMHLGATYGNGDLPTAHQVGKQRTESRGHEFFATGTYSVPVERERYNLEAALAYGPVKLQGEYANADFTGTGVNDSLDAYYVEALWLVTGENYSDAYKKGKFDRIKPKNDFSPDFKGGLGALEIGARYSEFDGTGISLAQSIPAQSAKEADSWTLGLKWLPTANARMMLTYVNTNYATPITFLGKTTDNDKAVMMRAQYDF